MILNLLVITIEDGLICYKSMIWICGLPLTIKEVYIRPDYPVRLHPSPVRLIRPRLVKMKTHSTGAFMSFDQV